MSETMFTARVLFSALPPDGGATPPGVRVTPHASRVEDDVISRAVTSAWYWPEAAESIAKHQAFLEVALAAEVGTPIESAVALTKAVSALAGQRNAVAVLWDATELAHDPDQWIAQSDDANAEDLPLFLWLAFDGEENADGSRGLRTRGVRAFGANEVEVAASRRDGEELLETVCDVTLVVLTSPVPLEDGDQVEVTLGKVRVRIEPSLRNDGHKAYRVRLP